MASKSVGGFDLLLGKYYNDFWFNAKMPNHEGPSCMKCHSPLTVHELEKFIFAFGKITVKACVIHTCPECLHEVLAIDPYSTNKKVPSTRKNLVAIFAKLPLHMQKSILGG